VEWCWPDTFPLNSPWFFPGTAYLRGFMKAHNFRFVSVKLHSGLFAPSLARVYHLSVHSEIVRPTFTCIYTALCLAENTGQI